MKQAQTPADVTRPLPPFDRPATVPDAKGVSPLKALFAGLALVVAAGCAAGTASLTPKKAQSRLHQPSNIARALPAVSPTPVPANQAGCVGGPGGASCQVQKNPNVGPGQSPTAGLTAAQLRSAYGLPPAASTGTPNGPTIAIVDAFDDANAESDLATYRKQMGLPPCTKANGCFLKVQLKPTPGATPPPPPPPPKSAAASTWDDEETLDLAMASAACPTCKLVLVESLGQDLDSLAYAVTVAATYNPAAISNSWGVPEGGGNAPNIDSDAQAAFFQPGIAITASAGDLGAGQVQFPASSPYVTAVGGTTLTASASSPRGWLETVWSGSGNGCSIMIATPAWQNGPCSARSVPDVSVIADYNPGVAVYSSADKGWVVLGGTSVGAPFIAGLYAAAQDYGAATTGAPAIYANLSALNVVDGVTFSPNGLAGF